MTYRRNFFSYFNFLGISFCIFIAWASYFGYKSLVINGLLAFFDLKMLNLGAPMMKIFIF